MGKQRKHACRNTQQYLFARAHTESQRCGRQFTLALLRLRRILLERGEFERVQLCWAAGGEAKPAPEASGGTSTSAGRLRWQRHLACARFAAACCVWPTENLQHSDVRSD